MIRVVDLETDDMDPPAPVLEAGICDLNQITDDGWEVGAPSSQVFWAQRLSPAARGTHHITYEEIADAVPFHAEAFCREIYESGFIVIAAHNWDFEAKWLTPDRLGILRPLCTYKAALRVWPDAPKHSNGALRYWLEDQGLIHPDHALTQPPHRAGPDAYTTAWILKALLRTTSARQMVAWTKEPRLLPTCPIGERQGWKGKPWAEVEGGFLYWVTQQAGMEVDICWNAQRELDRRSSNQTRT
jgi:exodeoxyribonuclease X